MKKSFYLCLCALLSLFTSCKDDCDYNSPTSLTSTNQDGQYLVMFYGVGGGNLDLPIALNILQALEAGSSDKVKMTFQYRFSKSYEGTEDLTFQNCENIQRFDADENVHLKGAFNATDTTETNIKAALKKYNMIRSTSLGDTDYIMASDTALTSFINWSKMKHPMATKTILIISNHGDGWHLFLDGLKDLIHDKASRSILTDDNTENSLSLGGVKRSLAAVGGVDVLYDDACLMSTWENLTGYSSVSKYFLGSLETAPGAGGNYHYLVNRLSESQVTDAGLESALRGYVDDIIDKWWDDSNDEEKIYGDMNLYNLQKIDAPLNLIRQITQKLTEKWQSTTPIPGLSTSAALGDEWKNYIRPAITNCIAATNHTSPYYEVSLVPKPLQNYLATVNAEIVDKDGKKCYYTQDVLNALKVANMEQYDSNQGYMVEYRELWNDVQKKTCDSYCFADFLRKIVMNLRDAGLDDSSNPFVAYQKQYIDAVKDMGYIRCTHPLSASSAADNGMIDYAYNCCSPGIFIYSFDKNVYEDKSDFNNRLAELIPDVDFALGIYRYCDFDKKTSWSKLLRLFDDIPSLISNPAREQYE